MDELKDRIRAVRKQSQFKTQESFAVALGTTRPAIASYELGKVVPSETFIQLLCSKFLINENWLRTGEGEMKSESDEDMLSRIAGEMNLTPLQTEAFKILMGLPEEDREVVAKAFFAILKSITKRPASPPVGKAYHELSDDEKVSRYKEQLKDEKKGPREESSVSTIGK